MDAETCEYLGKESDYTKDEWVDLTKSKPRVRGNVKKLRDQFNNFAENRLLDRVSSFIHELCCAAIKWKLPINPCAFLKQTKIDMAKQEWALMIIDALSLIEDELNLMGSEENDLTERTIRFKAFKRISERFEKEETISQKLRVAAGTTEAKGPTGRDKLSLEIRRVRTRLLFKQTKFNLYHEESEGYAKLVTLLFECDNDAKLLQERIRALIGAFQLEPGRVVCTILDTLEQDLSREETFVKVLKMFPARAIAPIAGFKVSHYHGDADADGESGADAKPKLKPTKAPDSLYRLVAALLKHKLIDIAAIYPYLNPLDAELEEAWTDFAARQSKEVDALRLPKVDPQARGQGAKGEIPQMPQRKTTYPSLFTDVYNDKFRLLRMLISAHAWPHVAYMLKRLAKARPASSKWISDELSSYVRHSIAPILAFLRGPSVFSKNKAAKTKSSKPLPPTSTIDAALKKIFRPLLHLGIYLYRDTKLFCELCRALDVVMAKNPAKFRATVETILREVMFPALSVSSNFALSLEMWKVLGHFDYMRRYALYGWWLNEVIRHKTKYPETTFATEFVKLANRRFQNRLTAVKGEDRKRAREMSRFIDCNPFTVFGAAYQKIHDAPNYIVNNPVLVESCRYASMLTLDIAGWFFLHALTEDMSRKRMIADGIQPTGWMDGFAKLGARLYKRLNTQLDIRPVLEFVARTLDRNDSSFLVVLSTFIDMLGGVKVVDTKNVAMNEKMALQAAPALRNYILQKPGKNTGTTSNLDEMGKELGKSRSFSMSQGARDREKEKELEKQQDILLEERKRESRQMKKAINQLVCGLTNRNLVAALFVYIAQRLVNVTHEEGSRHVPAICAQIDYTQAILSQYQAFIEINYPPEHYASHMPPIDVLISKYDLKPVHAFLLLRPIIQLEPYLARIYGEKSKNSDDAMDTSADGSEAKDEQKSEESSSKSGKQEVTEDDSSSSSSAARSRRKSVFSYRSEICESLKGALPEDLWTKISPEFYLQFWALKVSDLDVNERLYDENIKELDTAISKLERRSASASVGSRAIRNTEMELRRLKDIVRELRREREHQVRNAKAVMDRLKHSSDPWFPSNVEPPAKDYLAQQSNLLEFPEAPAENIAATEALFRHCFVSRAVFSAQDARLCVRVFKLLIDLNIRHFDLNAFLTVLSDSLLSYLAVFTQNEVTNYAQFVKGVMQLLRRWWQSEEYFKKEFCTSSASRGMDYDNFRVLYHQLHARFSYSFRDVFKKDVGYLSREGSHEMLSALLFWKETLGVYPHIKSHHEHLTDFLTEMEKVLDSNNKEKRSSLKASVLSILAKLAKIELCDDKLFSELPLERGRRRGIQNRKQKAAEQKKQQEDKLAQLKERALRTMAKVPAAPEAKANGNAAAAEEGDDATSPAAPEGEDGDAAPMEDDAGGGEEANGEDSPPAKNERGEKSNGTSSSSSSGRKRSSPLKVEAEDAAAEAADANGAAEPERKRRRHRPLKSELENGDRGDGHSKSSDKEFAKPRPRTPKEEPSTPERWKRSPTPLSDEDEDGAAEGSSAGEEASPRKSKASSSSSGRRRGGATEKRPRAPSADDKQRPLSAKKSRHAQSSSSSVKREAVHLDEGDDESDDSVEVVERERRTKSSKKKSSKKESSDVLHIPMSKKRSSSRRSQSPSPSPPPPPSSKRAPKRERERERESSSRGGSRRSSEDQRSLSRSRSGTVRSERDRSEKRERRKKRSPSPPPKRRSAKPDDDEARRRRRPRDHPRDGGGRSKRR